MRVTWTPGGCSRHPRVNIGILRQICYNCSRYAAIAQLVERIHGKDEVSGSTPDRGSRIVFNSGNSANFMLQLSRLLLLNLSETSWHEKIQSRSVS